MKSIIAILLIAALCAINAEETVSFAEIFADSNIVGPAGSIYHEEPIARTIESTVAANLVPPVASSIPYYRSTFPSYPYAYRYYAYPNAAYPYAAYPYAAYPYSVNPYAAYPYTSYPYIYPTIRLAYVQPAEHESGATETTTEKPE